jgi:hypothetical protein
MIGGLVDTIRKGEVLNTIALAVLAYLLGTVGTLGWKDPMSRVELGHSGITYFRWGRRSFWAWDEIGYISVDSAIGNSSIDEYRRSIDRTTITLQLKKSQASGARWISIKGCFVQRAEQIRQMMDEARSGPWPQDTPEATA